MRSLRLLDTPWLLIEEDFTLAREHEIESLFTTGNGAAGVRGALEEGSELSAPATFMAGVFSRADAPGAVPELLTFPNWIKLEIRINGTALHLAEGKVLEHRRILDLKHGVLYRQWRQSDSNGRITQFRSLRFASLADRRLLLQQVLLTAENYCLTAELESSIELRSEIELVLANKWNAVSKTECPSLLSFTVGQPDGKMAAEFSIATRMITPVASSSNERRIEIRDGHIVERLQIQAEPGAQCEFHRFISFCPVHNNLTPVTSAADHVSAAMCAGIQPALSAHEAEWCARVESANIEVKGDDALQQALRFGAYHLISAANPEDSRVSIGARALTGRGYKGHVFWDTEIYMLPFYIATHPASARAVLGYRYHTLPAAREKARAAGYRGAMYAWESADTGEDVTPAAVITPLGEVIAVRNGELEVHISADIAYAVWQYWQATADDEFLLKFGAEIILEAARFWASRGTFETDGQYHIRHVIGPDEYHEDVDDNAFTNLMAAWCLRRAAEVASLLETSWIDRWHAVVGRMQLTNSEVSLWPKLADVMATGFNPQTLLFEQFAGYFTKDSVDLNEFEPRFIAVDAILGHSRVGETNIVKQADVIMAIYLLWDQFSPEVREANFEYYEPRTAHGSSLSPSIHALVAARLGKMDLAQRYLKQAAEIDLGNNMGNAADGVHAAAIGGLWQAVVFGFAGLQSCSESLSLSPHVLPHWHRLSIPFQWRNERLRISIQRDSVLVNVSGPDAIKLRIANVPAFNAIPNRNYIIAREQHGWGKWQAA
jgi:trehalose/maltose hydrolase-like predicted phosphorylase